MEKLAPFGIPRSLQSARLLTPASKISTLPFLSVSAVQLINRYELHLMSAAGTVCPCSISASEVQFCPLLFVKNNEPDPLAGTLKLKFMPTPTHCEQLPWIRSSLLAP